MYENEKPSAEITLTFVKCKNRKHNVGDMLAHIQRPSCVEAEPMPLMPVVAKRLISEMFEVWRDAKDRHEFMKHVESRGRGMGTVARLTGDPTANIYSSDEFKKRNPKP